MQDHRGIAQYRKIDLQTVTPERMIVMLYEGLARFLGRAHAAVDASDVGERNRNLSKALAVVHALSDSLDHEVGATFTRDLTALYNYMSVEITECVLDGDARHIAHVLKTVSPLLDAWRRVAGGNDRRRDEVQVSNLAPAGTEPAKDAAGGFEDSGDRGNGTAPRSNLSVAI